MSLSAFRALLRTMGLSGYVLHGKDENFVVERTPVPALLETLRPPNGQRKDHIFERLEDSSSALALLADAIHNKLSHFAPAPPHYAANTAIFTELYNILVCAILQSLCEMHDAPVNLMPTAQAMLDRAQDRGRPEQSVLLDDIGALLKAKAVRALILRLSAELLDCDGRTIMGNLEITFPTMSNEADPQWSNAYQQDDDATQFWLYQTLNGKGLFVVLFGRRCAYKQCVSCSLHTIGREETIATDAYFKQINSILDNQLTPQEIRGVKEMVLSNNGSLLDQSTMPFSALLYATSRFASSLPNLAKIILETRAEYIDVARLRLLQETLDYTRTNIGLELAVGVEVHDEKLRNKTFRKGLLNKGLLRCAEHVKEAGASLRLYYMYKPIPDMTDARAQQDIVDAVKFAENLMAESGIEITIHLNPTYVSAGTALETAFNEGRYKPPTLTEVCQTLQRIGKTPINIYVGLNDEGLSIEGGSFIAPGEEALVHNLRKFNATQILND